MPIDTALSQLPLTPDQIYSACRHVTPHLAKELIRGQAVIPRKNVRTLLDRFLTSPHAWKQACAVYTLGFFWESDAHEIQSARYAEAFLIRYAGDAALEMRRRHRALQPLVEQFPSANTLVRLSAYLAIEQQGDEQTLWALDTTVHETDLAHTFLRQLVGDVHDRLRNERRRRADEERKLNLWL